ncbi:4-coumarate--CoA ligase-like 7 [Lamellibrachia satsuma]|nr:4-coumarate--CoA ligase-like 7 [Lamellibrachia satsuma]
MTMSSQFIRLDHFYDWRGLALPVEMIISLYRGECYTYRGLQTAVGAVSQRLSRQGFHHNSVLALFCNNCPKFVVMTMAAWRLGGAIAGINHLLKTDEVHQQLRMCDAEFLFTTPSIAPTALQAARGTLVKKIYATDESPGCESFATLTRTTSGHPPAEDDERSAVDPRTDTAIILFSSGTTGSAKGVQLTHYNFVSIMLLLGHPALDIQTTEHTVIFHPLSHVFGLQLVVAALQLGRTVLLLPRFQLNVYLDVVSKYKIETLILVPSIAVLLAKSPLVDRYDLSSVRYISCGSAPLSSDVEEEMKRRIGSGLYVGQGYGLTETSAVLTLTPNADSGVTLPPATVGLPLPGTQMKVIDLKTGQPVAHDTRGEIVARGPQIMKGYLKNDKATREMIDSDGWLHTGDIGYYNQDGYFFVVDRLKELIKYNSYQHSSAVQSRTTRSTVPRYSQYSPTLLAVQSRTTRSTVPHYSQYSPALLAVQSRATRSTVPCYSQYSPALLAVQYRATHSTVPHYTQYSLALLAAQYRTTRSTVPHYLQYSPTLLTVQSRTTRSTVPHYSQYSPALLAAQSRSTVPHYSQYSPALHAVQSRTIRNEVPHYSQYSPALLPSRRKARCINA